MSKINVTRLFVGAILAAVAGLVVAITTVVASLAGGVATIGGPSVISVDGPALAGTLGWLLLATLFIAGGAIAVVASWIGALRNTVRLDDKTWFVALLILGLCSFGWIAMVAYVISGPDATRQDIVRSGTQVVGA